MKPLLMEVHGFTGKIFQIFRNNSSNLKETLRGTEKKEMLPDSLCEVRLKMLDNATSIKNGAEGLKKWYELEKVKIIRVWKKK